VHGIEFVQGVFRRYVYGGKTVFEQGQEQIGKITDKDVSDNSVGEPVMDRLEFDNAFEGAKRFLHQVLVEAKSHQVVLWSWTRSVKGRRGA
jgi:hypothetical protein